MLNLPVADAITRYLDLQTQQMHATAANMANENTAGYTRRTVTWSENDTVQIGGVSVGRGATATVSAQRDRVLDRSVQQATDTASASTARLGALQNVQSLFTVNSSGDDSSGIGSAINGFFASISAVAADPTSAAARQATIAAAQTVASTFNRTAAQLSSQQSGLNQQVTTSVAQVNQLIASISKINGQIGQSSPGLDTSSLEDQRTLQITQLSQLIGVQQSIGQDNTVTLTTGNAAELVSGNQSFPLTTANVSGTIRIYASASQGSPDITSTIQGGSIGGILQARDTDLPAIQSQLDTLAFDFATAVNTQNQAGKGSDGLAGTAIFSIGATPTGASGAIGVSLTNASNIAAAASAEASGGSGNAQALLALQNANITSGTTPTNAYSGLLSGLGSTVASAQSDSNADAAIQTQLSTQRDTVSGVSLDEEAANLTQYQRSYQAAAKVLSILNELLASAINIGTNTAFN